MKFAEPWWLLGAAASLLVAAFYVWGGLGIVAATKRFGQPELVTALITDRAGGRRALKGALVVLAVAFAFVALAGPQYGRGTRLIPATNLDCVIVLDYSKSMYAQDVAPSRTERAKAEVARLIGELPGARFGAVAFAGEPLSFPLTSDGGAIAQFFRQTTPNDMPIGGTAIARALESARELLERDPLSNKHQKVILLVTDGEDLEGNPVEVAEAAAKAGVVINVVQIGGRTPEMIPVVDESGQITGMRKDARGMPLTTALSVEGEKQLADIARVASGKVVQAAAGQTGIDEIARDMLRMMTEELAERVETVYADVFFYPLGLALLLLALEVFVPVARKRKATALLAALCLFGCKQTEQSIFSRHSPVVDEAIQAIESADAGDAMNLLTEYLSTGRCKDGALGTPDQVRELPSASLDLGLALFQLAERFGGTFGEPAPDPSADPNTAGLLAKRSERVDCALRLVRVIAADPSVPLPLRAKAYYLSGNLEFLRHDYRSAVSSYDQAIKLSPGGATDAGADLGTQAAFNRAIALQRAEEDDKNKPPPPDGGTPPPNDGGGEPSDDEQDQKDQEQQDQKDQEQQDQKDQEQQDQKDQEQQDQKDQEQQDQKDQKDQKSQSENAPPAPSAQPSAQPPSLSQDERVLDELERAPMFQHVDKDQRARVRVNMEDK